MCGKHSVTRVQVGEKPQFQVFLGAGQVWKASGLGRHRYCNYASRLEIKFSLLSSRLPVPWRLGPVVRRPIDRLLCIHCVRVPLAAL